MSTTAQICRKCQKWFKSMFGDYQVIPNNYDCSLCSKCNREIDTQEEDINFEQLKEKLTK